jgi:hypothetical protein
MRPAFAVKSGSIFFLLFLVACSSGEGLPQPTTGAVVSATTAHVTLASKGGGFGPSLPQGAACDPGVWSYAITLASHDVAWNGCAMNGSWDDPAAFVPASSDEQVDAATWAPIQSALNQLAISYEKGCGADAASRDLTIDDPTGTVVYGDDFYACLMNYPRYVTTGSLDVLQTTLTNLP